MLHPTAIIDPAAQLAPGVIVGPYAIIESGARLGPGCVIHGHAVLTGDVELGAHVTVGHGAVIGGVPQDFSYTPDRRTGVTIADHVTIREHVTIHRGAPDGSRTTVGPRCYLMAGVHLGHNVTLHEDVVIANDCLLAGHVEVQRRAFLGGGSGFHQHMRIGAIAIVRGGSRISKDIPPFTLATGDNELCGLNVVGLRRAGLTPAERAEVKAAYKLLFHSGLNTAPALAAAAAQPFGPHALELFNFIAQASKRSFCRPSPRKSSEISHEMVE